LDPWFVTRNPASVFGLSVLPGLLFLFGFSQCPRRNVIVLVIKVDQTTWLLAAQILVLVESVLAKDLAVEIAGVLVVLV
jgi:hypothetical protein